MVMVTVRVMVREGVRGGVKVGCGSNESDSGVSVVRLAATRLGKGRTGGKHGGGWWEIVKNQ